MQDATNLPNEIDQCHAIIREQEDVIRAMEAISVEQAGAIDDLVKSNDKLKKEADELQLAVKKLLEGNRREKFFNPLEANEVIAALTSDDKKTPNVRYEFHTLVFRTRLAPAAQ